MPHEHLLVTILSSNVKNTTDRFSNMARLCKLYLWTMYRGHVTELLKKPTHAFPGLNYYVTSLNTTSFGPTSKLTFVSLALGTCILWGNLLSHICQRIRHHFKHSVDKLIIILVMLYINCFCTGCYRISSIFSITLNIRSPSIFSKIIILCASKIWSQDFK